MRKLRRLPWRIPKSHHAQPDPVQAEAQPRVEPQKQISKRELRQEAIRESLSAQPVAFAGGRYVYGDKASLTRPPRAPEIRRKARHPIPPTPVTG